MPFIMRRDKHPRLFAKPAKNLARARKQIVVPPPYVRRRQFEELPVSCAVQKADFAFVQRVGIRRDPAGYKYRASER